MKNIDKAINCYNIYSVMKHESKKQIKEHLRYYTGIKKVSDLLLDQMCIKMGIQNAAYIYE
jgi:hypothetical protein